MGTFQFGFFYNSLISLMNNILTLKERESFINQWVTQASHFSGMRPFCILSVLPFTDNNNYNTII